MVTIAFLGLVQTIEPLVPKLVWFLESLHKAGLSSRCIFGENGSSDATRQALEAEDRSDWRIVDTSFMAEIAPRLKRIAYGRQKLKDELSQSAWRCDFVCVVDWDVLLAAPPSAEAIADTIKELETRVDLFAVSPTSKPTYYDLLAFEDQERSFAELPRQQSNARYGVLSPFRLYFGTIYPAQARLTVDHEILAFSAFNGMCIYKQDAFHQGSYIAGERFEICEHVTFNRGLAASGKRIAVLPSLCLAAPEEHTRKTVLTFTYFRLQRLFGQILRPRIRRLLKRGA